MQEYGWKMDEMNMKRTMGCKIWIACQDQIYGMMMGCVGRCMDNEEGTWKVHMDGRKESESQDQGWKRIKRIKIYG